MTQTAGVRKHNLVLVKTLDENELSDFGETLDPSHGFAP